MKTRLLTLLLVYALCAAAEPSEEVPVASTADDQMADRCRAEFRYLRRVCHEFDVDGPATRMTGLQSDVPQTQWPFMQFCYFGFACANLASYDPEMRSEAVAEVRWLLNSLQKPRLSGFVTDHFGAPFGDGFAQPSVFVHGFFLSLAVRYREVTADRQFDPLTLRVASTLSRAFRESKQGILPTYRDLWWPTDNLPALSALARYDQMFGTDLSNVRARYLRSIREHYLDENGMIGSYIDPSAGQVLQGARGVGMAYALHFLRDVDAAFAADQYLLAKRHFFRTALGFGAVREFPEGITDVPDIDSGMVVFGLGTAASGFFLGAAAVNEDEATATALLHSLALFSGPDYRCNPRECALTNMPPVGQAVLLFGRTEFLKYRNEHGHKSRVDP